MIRKFQTRQILTLGIDHIWGADLLIMTKYANENNGFKYILNVIDCFSKYAWSVPLKTKFAIDVAEAFEKILLESEPRKPKLLHCDRGSEFIGKAFKTMLKRHDIRMYHTFSELKSSIVERFNRTLNEKLKIQFEVTGNFKWLNILPDVLIEYNEHSIHRTIGTTPSAVNGENENEIFNRIYRKKKGYSKI